MRKINEIIVHCTATHAGWWDGKKTSEKVAEVKKWHTDPKPNGRGWSDIGYHYLIDRDGTVQKGRPVARAGAHALGHNKHSIGISLFGGHGSSENDAFNANFTPEQDKALRRLIGQLQSGYGIRTVSGHNEYAAKACPGFRVGRWINNRPPEKKSAAQSTTVQATVATGVAGAGGVFTALSKLDPQTQMIVAVFGAVALIGLGWILRERIRKFAAGDR